MIFRGVLAKTENRLKQKTHLAFVQRDASGVNVPNIATRGKGSKKILQPRLENSRNR